MKKLGKKKLIIIFLILIIIVIASILFIVIDKSRNNSINNNESKMYEAYVDINPLIKLNFKVSCDKDNNCSNPIITDYELINEDAKTIYKDLVLKDKTLKETIELLTSTAKDNDIVFKEVHIYSNYDKEEAFKVESADYTITFDTKTDSDLEHFIDELVLKKENTITKEVLVPFLYYVPDEMKNQDMSSLDALVFDPDITATIIDKDKDSTTLETQGIFKFLEHEDLVTKMICQKKDFKNESDENETTEATAFKVKISGPTDLINTIPDKLCGYSNSYVEAMLKITESKVGEYVLPVNIVSKNPNIEVLNPTKIDVKFRIIRLGDANVSYVYGS